MNRLKIIKVLTNFTHALATNAEHVTDTAMIARITEVRVWIANTHGGAPEHAFDTLADWSRKAGLPGLDALGISGAHRADAAASAAVSSSMKANPVPLDPNALAKLMENAR